MTEPEQADGGDSRLRNAATRLFEALDQVPDFEPCRGPAESWPEDVRRKRLPVWDICPDHWGAYGPQRVKDAWFAFGRGKLVFWEPGGRGVHGATSPGIYDSSRRSSDALARVMAAAATMIPAEVRQNLAEGWRAVAQVRPPAEPEVFIQNEWHLRRAALAAVIPIIKSCLPQAKRAVIRVQGDVRPLDELIKDDVLHCETVDAALAQLRPVMETTEGEHADGPTATGGAPALMTGQQAAQLIGVSEATLPRWRRDIPKWASGNTVLFLHLIDRDRQLYHRHNVLKLAKWYAAAQNTGAQAPVDCP